MVARRPDEVVGMEVDHHRIGIGIMMGRLRGEVLVDREVLRRGGMLDEIGMGGAEDVGMPDLVVDGERGVGVENLLDGIGVGLEAGAIRHGVQAGRRRREEAEGEEVIAGEKIADEEAEEVVDRDGVRVTTVMVVPGQGVGIGVMIGKRVDGDRIDGPTTAGDRDAKLIVVPNRGVGIVLMIGKREVHVFG